MDEMTNNVTSVKTDYYETDKYIPYIPAVLHIKLI